MDISQLPPQIQAMLQSQEARQLRQLITAREADTVQKAAAAMQSGDEKTLRQTLQPLLQDPQLVALLQKMMSQGGS